MQTVVTSPTVAFANKLHPYLGESDENSFYSPYSVHLALGMCQAGAKGDTLRALAGLLESPLDPQEARNFFRALVAEVNSKDERPYELVTANALWGQADYHFNTTYGNTIRDYYGGTFQEVDYLKKEEAVATINGWCAKNTRNKIPTIITERFINEDTRLVLTNAIYFKGKWLTEFDKKLTRDAAFATPDGNKKQVPTMHRTGSYHYYENGAFQVLDLPYKGDTLSMLVVLPKMNTTEIIDHDLSGVYEVASVAPVSEKVVVSLPRFKLETSCDLTLPLKQLGAEVAFSNAADFSGITTQDRLKISGVVHKAFVEVDEEGTEAAAATAVGVTRCAIMLPDPPPKVFNVDHPFVFFIRNRKTGNVLFCGRVTDPTV